MKKTRLATCLANILDHFDTSLYGFLVPILAPLFFPKNDQIIILLQGYGIMIVGFITRPLGAWYFSKKADAKGPHQVLTTTVLGMTMTTLCFTLLCPYESWGVGSAAGLCFLRGMQNFFGAGETSIAGLYILENSEPSQQHPLTSIYLSSTMIGILLACFVSSILFYSDMPQMYWKWPFYGSIFTGFAGWWLRRQNSLKTFHKKTFNKKSDWKTIIKLIPITGFSYMLYSIPFVFFNSFASLVTNIEMKDLMTSNTALMMVDLGLLALFGHILRNVSAQRILQFILILSMVIIPFLFLVMPQMNLMVSMFIRLIFIILGVAFCIPLHRWYMEKIPEQNRYSTTAIGYAIGSEIFGRSFPAVGLALWHMTQQVVMPGIYIVFLGILAFLSISSLPKQLKVRYK
ncbi:MAG: MFS transporter [Pseudomonadota bacterium]|jgi:MFS family permease|nr:MFS transporter [Alphaproteobacteria bacterium]